MNVIIWKKNKRETVKMLDRLLTFSKAQVSAFVGGIIDYLIMIFCTEVFHIHYTISIVIGGIIGAIVNFSVNKFWTFHSKEIPYVNSKWEQLVKFILVAINSIFLKSSGTFIVTTFLRLDYKISRIFIDLVVSLCINYTLQRYWVFKKKEKPRVPSNSTHII